MGLRLWANVASRRGFATPRRRPPLGRLVSRYRARFSFPYRLSLKQSVKTAINYHLHFCYILSYMTRCSANAVVICGSLKIAAYQISFWSRRVCPNVRKLLLVPKHALLRTYRAHLVKIKKRQSVPGVLYFVKNCENPVEYASISRKIPN